MFISTEKKCTSKVALLLILFFILALFALPKAYATNHYIDSTDHKKYAQSKNIRETTSYQSPTEKYPWLDYVKKAALALGFILLFTLRRFLRSVKEIFPQEREHESKGNEENKTPKKTIEPKK
jgi:hypothetical protein